jgi:tetratricopeptide (TPR) repeat protein
MPRRVDLKTPYKWLRGSTPRPPWPDLTACVLSCELGCAIGVEELCWGGGSGILSVPADTGLASPWTAAGVLEAVDAVTDTGSMDRRVFFHLAGGALTEPALEWLIARPATDLDGFAGRRGRWVQATHVDAIEEMTAQLRRMDDRFGGGTVLDLVRAQVRHVLDLVRAQVRHVLDLLRDNAYSASIGIRLHACAAELLRLAGFLSFDAGRQGEAQRFWLAALRAAHAAGDRAIGANILGFLSCQAKDLDLLQEAIKLAEAARQGYPGGSPRVSAILHLRAAQAYAQTQEVRECRTAIDRAYEALRDTAPQTSDPAWAYWLDEAQVNEQIGYCYTRLEDWDRAGSHLRLALRLQEAPDTREGALRRALLAVTYARQGDCEQACHTAAKAVDLLARDVDSDRCVGHVRRVQQALGPYRRHATVAEFNDRVDQAFGSGRR